MMENIFVFIASIFLIIKGAALATKYALRLAINFKISKYIIGFMVIAVLSLLPEAFISINSALQGVPELGLGTLFGNNITDLTLVFALIIIFTKHGIKIESKILKQNVVYPFILLIPIVLGLDGYYSRWEGLGLIIVGVIFYYLALKNNKNEEVITDPVLTSNKSRLKDFLLLIFSMALLLVGSHFVVTSTINIADYLNISSVIIGMIVVGVGTTMPELFFGLSAVRNNHDSLAVGDILGTVLADATIIVGLLAFFSPFYFPLRLVYSTGIFMVVSSFILFYFMRSGKIISKKEGYLLFLLWVTFVLIEIIFNS